MSDDRTFHEGYAEGWKAMRGGNASVPPSPRVCTNKGGGRSFRRASGVPFSECWNSTASLQIRTLPVR
jgi:hypothetical protein